MTDAIVEASRRSIEVGSGSFAAAARLFPAGVREDAWMLYAWCRRCDDVVDGQVLGRGAIGLEAEAARARLAGLEAQTRRAFRGEPMDDPAFAAFQRVALSRRIELRHALDLLKGFAMDADGRSYRRLEDTLQYAYHVAGVVGVMMAQVMGVTDRAALGRAADLGLAFQLTNIARDVLEDARGGRVYLPSDWLGGIGSDPEAVLDPRNRPRVFAATLQLLEAAEPYYASARWGLSVLPFRSAWAIASALGVYRAIGDRVAALGPEGMERRAATSGLSKGMRMVQAGLVAARARTLDARILRPASDPLWAFAAAGEAEGRAN